MTVSVDCRMTVSPVAKVLVFDDAFIHAASNAHPAEACLYEGGTVMIHFPVLLYN
jgi:hypothetical protein